MYPSPHHQTHDKEKMIAVIKRFPLAMLVSAENEEVHLTHLPIIYNTETDRLVAHIDKNNPQSPTLYSGKKVTTIFKGYNCYISPSVYSSKDQLPTWNYIAVHIKGTVHLIDDPKETKESMIAMTRFLEGKEQKFILEEDNPKMERFVNYIQAFEIEIEDWEGKFKLSQDKSTQDFENAKLQLINKSNEDTAGFIEFIYK